MRTSNRALRYFAERDAHCHAAMPCPCHATPLPPRRRVVTPRHYAAATPPSLYAPPCLRFQFALHRLRRQLITLLFRCRHEGRHTHIHDGETRRHAIMRRAHEDAAMSRQHAHTMFTYASTYKECRQHATAMPPPMFCVFLPLRHATALFTLRCACLPPPPC